MYIHFDGSPKFWEWLLYITDLIQVAAWISAIPAAITALSAVVKAASNV